MPSFARDGIEEDGVGAGKLNGNPAPEGSCVQESPKSPQKPHHANPTLPIDGVENTSIEQLVENVCDLQSSDQSPSRPSIGSSGEESRIDFELHHLVGGKMREIEIMEEAYGDQHSGKKEIISSGTMGKTEPMSTDSSVQSMKAPHFLLASEGLLKSTLNTNPPLEKTDVMNNSSNSPVKGVNSHDGTGGKAETGLDSPDVGSSLLKQARDLISSGENYQKALELALKAVESFEKCTTEKPSLELVMCLHTMAEIYCGLGQYDKTISVLEESVKIPVIEAGKKQMLAKFAGHMQLGDTYAMLGQLEKSISCYKTGLDVQRHALGETDAQVGGARRYVAEAYLQALQFDEAEKLCQTSLDLHKENGSSASIDEARDRRLMALICEMKGAHESALEHLVLASMVMSANGNEMEVGLIDISIGDAYLSLARYNEARYAYQKAVMLFKSSKGDNHPTVASVYVRLADLYNKMRKIRESKSYCESALRIFEKPNPGTPAEVIATGLTDVSAIYESMNELDEAVKLLKKALEMFNEAVTQPSIVAGIEAQMGVLYYMLGNYCESYSSFKNSIFKLRASGEKKSVFFGIVLNQMGLACVQCFSINVAVNLFEEAKDVLEQECGPYHPDTLGVYSNLAATYDAAGRLDDAIEIMELLVGMREERLGTANPEVEDEKRRLAELLKEAGRVGCRKIRSLEVLLDADTLFRS